MEPFVRVSCQFEARHSSRWRQKGLTSNGWLRGEKNTLTAFGDAQDIYHELLLQFPKLSQAGGFELLRTPERGGRQEDVIAAPESGYTVTYLRAVVHNAKIYIRPMQRDLGFEPVKEEVSVTDFYTSGKIISLK